MPDPRISGITPARQALWDAPRIVVKTSGAGVGIPAAHAWAQQVQDGSGNYIADTEGMSGTTTNAPLYAASGQALPSGTLCEAIYNYAGYYIGWPFGVLYRPQCLAGFLVGMVSTDGGNTWVKDAAYTLLLGCIPCPACSNTLPGCPCSTQCYSLAVLTSTGLSQVVFAVVNCYGQTSYAYLTGTAQCHLNLLYQGSTSLGPYTWVLNGDQSCFGTYYGQADCTLANHPTIVMTDYLGNTVSLVPVSCTGGMPLRTNLTTAYAFNGRTLTSPPMQVDSGQVLLVSIGIYLTSGLVGAVTVTFGTTTMTLVQTKANTADANLVVYQYKATGVSGGGNIVVDVGVGNAADILISACEVSVIAGTNDVAKTADGVTSNIDSAAAANTATAVEYAMASSMSILPVITNPSGDPKNGFLSGQLVKISGTTGRVLMLRDDYQILQSRVVLDALVTFQGTGTPPPGQPPGYNLPPSKWAIALETFS